MRSRLANRAEAGRALGEKLRAAGYADRRDVLVLALPRGGVPVAYEVAKILRAPLDVFVVRKLGTPGQEELAMGAIASGGVRVLNEDVVRMLGISDAVIEHATAMQQAEVDRRERELRGDRPVQDVNGKVVIVIDDGLATGATMRAAVAALRQRKPARVVVAVPVAARETLDEFSREMDEVVCVLVPPWLQAIGQWYADFEQTSDEEVRELLARSASQVAPASGGDYRGYA